MPSPWNDATDRQLLLTIIHLTAPSLPKWDQVATMMGDGFTAESVRQHFQKLRKEAKAQLGEPDRVTPGAGGPKGTPRKSAACETAGGTPSKSTGKRKSKTNTAVDPEDADEHASPTKKIKAEPAQDDEDDFA
ncbi:hypothetical protein Tdes44962_MAKER09584 [Teratosphaeria destructans]|uniref:Myb-like domain-containing protein n=1 Tax=Teratosphaeria destructans TaxID=418781 RepID=A0A9W7W2H2_9PEZI|nr:hypothetical protein Tdes44962_MAKER09584 [Teratosphaeria destructans]